MKHHDTNRKFGRKRDQRRALLRSLASSFIRDERITTTEARAKELRVFVEKLVTVARKNTLTSRRLVLSRLGGEEGVRKLMNEIAPRYTDRPGGYTRITKLPRRSGDASPLALIEFV